MSRKLLIGAMVVLLVPFGTGVQAQAVLGALCIAIALQVYYHPYESPLTDLLEMASLGSSFVTLYFGLMLHIADDHLNSGMRILFTFIIVGVNLGFLLCFLYFLYLILQGKVATDEFQDRDKPAGPIEFVCRKYLFKYFGRCFYADPWPTKEYKKNKGAQSQPSDAPWTGVDEVGSLESKNATEMRRDRRSMQRDRSSNSFNNETEA